MGSLRPRPIAASSRRAAGCRSLLSPRVLFSLLVGFGAGGCSPRHSASLLRVAAVLAGAARFEALLVGPLWRLLFRFESRAARSRSRARSRTTHAP